MIQAKYILPALLMIAMIVMTTTHGVLAQVSSDKPVLSKEQTKKSETAKTTTVKNPVNPFADPEHDTSFSWDDCQGTVRSGSYGAIMSGEDSSDTFYNDWSAKWSWPSSEDYINNQSNCVSANFGEVDNSFTDETQSYTIDGGESLSNSQSSFVQFSLNGNVADVNDDAYFTEEGDYACSGFPVVCGDTHTFQSSSFSILS